MIVQDGNTFLFAGSWRHLQLVCGFTVMTRWRMYDGAAEEQTKMNCCSGQAGHSPHLIEFYRGHILEWWTLLKVGLKTRNVALELTSQKKKMIFVLYLCFVQETSRSSLWRLNSQWDEMTLPWLVTRWSIHRSDWQILWTVQLSGDLIMMIVSCLRFARAHLNSNAESARFVVYNDDDNDDYSYYCHYWNIWCYHVNTPCSAKWRKEVLFFH